MPGMTKYPPEAVSVIPYINIESSPLIQRNIVLIATAVINEENLFSNGLFQNVYLFYRMFESMGWLPILVVNKKPEASTKIPPYMKDVRLVSIEDIAKHPIPIKLYIEIGMSIDSQMRKFLKMCGAKVCKLYLGNILNIDIETPIFYPTMHFAHHVIGDLDEIWVSPHYFQHGQYAQALNHVPIDKPVAVPYIWDPQILTNNGEKSYQWRASENTDEDVFLILEPNISFQKSSLVPLMIMEAWFRKNPDWKGSVVMVNGERLLMIPFFKETIWNNLDIVKAGRVQMKGRLDILTILKTYASAIPICHQWNNEYNYMVLEYFWTGYPVLHNASDWSSFGYYYPNSDIAAGVRMIDKVRSGHRENFETYRSHARSLAWRHSPYNPDVQRAWSSFV